MRQDLSLATFAGCEVGYGTRHDRGYVAVASAVETPPPDAVYVQDAPPPDIVEESGRAPGPDYIWVGGFYEWDGGRYVWRRGHWDRPPHPGERFERDHWARGPHGYFVVRGGWR